FPDSPQLTVTLRSNLHDLSLSYPRRHSPERGDLSGDEVARIGVPHIARGCLFGFFNFFQHAHNCPLSALTVDLPLVAFFRAFYPDTIQSGSAGPGISQGVRPAAICWR